MYSCSIPDPVITYGVSSQRYALAALSLWEEPGCQWIGSLMAPGPIMTMEEARYMAQAFLTQLLCRDE
jgi:hypothetical protein